MSPAPGLNSLIAQLRDDLAFRRIGRGMQTLEGCKPLLDCLGPSHPCAGILIGVVAQWVDTGFAEPSLVRDLLARFPSRSTLPLVDYLHVRLADGMMAMAEEDFDQAVSNFRLVQSLAGDVDDPHLTAIASFWTARCLRHVGKYDDALLFATQAKRLALDSGWPGMGAVMQVLESWLAFQKGKLKEAAGLLAEAEAALRDTDDYVTRGNIQSAYGRIGRRQGRYQQALECFEAAIAEYKRRDPQHLHLARSLMNIAVVERLIALRSAREMDRASARRRAGDTYDRPPESNRARLQEIEALRARARAHLAEASQIYMAHAVHHGIGSVYVNSGLLHLDSGDLERAAGDAIAAFRQGEEKRDYIVMSRARILQSTIENARLEEQIGEDPAQHARAALDFARDAVEFARQTQNRRLLARACICQGLTLAGDYFQDQAAARRCLDEARVLLQAEGQEPESEMDDFLALQAKVLGAGGIDPMLKEWSDGITGDKSFQQITNEFAAVIIPKVWERENRKISRVAEKLSISPKKVRRILQASGLLHPPTAVG